MRSHDLLKSILANPEQISYTDVQSPWKGLYTLEKRDGRLWVFQMDQPWYTPPDFVRREMKDRRLIRELVDRLNQGDSQIKSIVWFETATRPLVSKS